MAPAHDSTSRLRWLCRRGTREMDLLLLRFLEQGYPHLNPGEKTLFGALLDETDPDLYAWLTGQSEPANPDYLPLISKINSRSRGNATNVVADKPTPARSQPDTCPLSDDATNVIAHMDCPPTGGKDAGLRKP